MPIRYDKDGNCAITCDEEIEANRKAEAWEARCSELEQEVRDLQETVVNLRKSLADRVRECQRLKGAGSKEALECEIEHLKEIIVDQARDILYYHQQARREHDEDDT